MNAKGKLIVLEGLDGSGKATQTALLCAALQRDGIDAGMLSFPCYEEESSALVRLYLGGAFGSDPDQVNGYAASVFFAADRYASFKQHWSADYSAGRVLLCDRYTTSNAVYQAGKLPRADWDDYLAWLYDLEYDRLGIPAPDLVVYLDMEPETSRALTEKRYTGDDSRKDIHERDIEFQRRSRAAALYCAQKGGWRIIACDGGGALRGQQDIAHDVYAIVREVVQ